MSRRNIKFLIEDMLEAIINIEEFTENFDFHGFVEDKKTLFAVHRNIEIIGEAASRIPKEFTDNHPQIEWQKIIRSRHIIVHEYFGIDSEIIWKIITTDLAVLELELNLINNQLA